MKRLCFYRIPITFFALLFIAQFTEAFSQTTVKVMYYNLLWYPNSDEGRDTLYQKILDDIDPDILVVTEMKKEGVVPFFNNVISRLGDKPYAQSSFHPDDQSDVQLYYNTDLFTLGKQAFISADTRDINEYVLVFNNDPTIKLHVLGAHLKASSGTEEEQRRLAQCTAYREYMNAHEDDAYTIFGGDFNFYKASEPGFQYLIAEGDDQLFDPIEMLGNWHVNADYSAQHTQSTRAVGRYTGGLDDRFDFMLVSESLFQKESLVQYVSGTYKAYGNDGGLLDKAIDDENNDALDVDLLKALKNASDHLPVIMDICLNCSE